jgi:hypothetical protein
MGSLADAPRFSEIDWGGEAQWPQVEHYHHPDQSIVFHDLPSQPAPTRQRRPCGPRARHRGPARFSGVAPAVDARPRPPALGRRPTPT